MAVKPLLVASLAALVLLAPGCGGDGESSAPTPSSATTAQQSGDADKGDDYRGGEASIEDFGSEAQGAEREAILSSFTGYLNALAEKDYEAACSYLAVAARSSLRQLAADSKAPCSALLPGLLSTTAPTVAREQAEGDVTRIRVEGEQGFVVFHAPGAELYQQTMIAEGGKWRVQTVAASILVPSL